MVPLRWQTGDFSAEATPVGALRDQLRPSCTGQGRVGYTTWTFLPPKTRSYLFEAFESVLTDKMTLDAYMAGIQPIFDREKAAVPPLPCPGSEPPAGRPPIPSPAGPAVIRSRHRASSSWLPWPPSSAAWSWCRPPQRGLGLLPSGRASTLPASPGSTTPRLVADLVFRLALGHNVQWTGHLLTVPVGMAW